MMTVSYTKEVSRAQLCRFFQLLFRWKGSIYRLLYREMIIYALLYYLVVVFYRIFEAIAIYCREFTDLIPLTFILGFYVVIVVGRWWNQYLALPFVDKVMLRVNCFVVGDDADAYFLRNNMARYLCVMTILTGRSVSTTVHKHYPTLKSIFDKQLITVDELRMLQEYNGDAGIWWFPAVWFCQLAMKARFEEKLTDNTCYNGLTTEFMTLRDQCFLMWSYDWITVPLVYTQVVTISVYCYFLTNLFARQYLEIDNNMYIVDKYIPIYTFFQFFFYVGWLKVAEEMMSPYGEDDDDFDVMYVLDRNIDVAFRMVNDMHVAPGNLVFFDPRSGQEDLLKPNEKQTNNPAPNSRGPKKPRLFKFTQDSESNNTSNSSQMSILQMSRHNSASFRNAL